MSKPKAPPPADYAGAAKEQGQQNVYASLVNSLLNRPNEYGPDGSRVFTQSGTQKIGDYEIPTYDVTTSLSPDQAELRDRNNNISKQLLIQGQEGLDQVRDQFSQPLDFSGLPALTGGSDISSRRDQLVAGLKSRLQPDLQQEEAALQTKLLNSGITSGSEAEGNALRSFNEMKNDRMVQADLQGGQQALQEALATSQSGNQARAQGIQELSFRRNEPLNMVNALRTGNQASLPNFQAFYAGNNTAAAPTFAGTQAAEAAAQQAYQQKIAGYNGLMSGLASLGGAAIGKWSDERLKQDIVLSHTRSDGLNVYWYSYIWAPLIRHLGVLAQEVKNLYPEAVGKFQGHYYVNYALLGNLHG